MVAIDTATSTSKQRPSKALPASAHQRVVYKTSEFIAILYYSTAWFLQRYILPLSWSWQDSLLLSSNELRILIGCSLLLVGGGIVAKVHAELHKYSQPHEPGLPTTRLVQTGPFSVSRNPIYLAFVGFLFPGSILLTVGRNTLGLVLLWPLSVIAFDLLLIREEEDYLQKQFGVEWQAYCLTTRRWI